MIKKIFWFFEDLCWNARCSYNFWLHGPYGLTMTIERMPFRFIIKYLRKYGASIGERCRFERGLNIHRPFGNPPFENLIIGNDVYLGHNTIIDLSRKVEIQDKVIIASRCQIWTHSSFYDLNASNKKIYQENYGDVVIKNGVIIFSGVVISSGIKVGNFSVIGGCSLVNKDVESNTFVGGVPARFIKKREI